MSGVTAVKNAELQRPAQSWPKNQPQTFALPPPPPSRRLKLSDRRSSAGEGRGEQKYSCCSNAVEIVAIGSNGPAVPLRRLDSDQSSRARKGGRSLLASWPSGYSALRVCDRLRRRFYGARFAITLLHQLMADVELPACERNSRESLNLFEGIHCGVFGFTFGSQVSM